jgi:hypothetical protein
VGNNKKTWLLVMSTSFTCYHQSELLHLLRSSPSPPYPLEG